MTVILKWMIIVEIRVFVGYINKFSLLIYAELC